ncbi:hypothetical protein DRO35_05740, partial [Candidatus Bathyarchaeota archaeon]
TRRMAGSYSIFGSIACLPRSYRRAFSDANYLRVAGTKIREWSPMLKKITEETTLKDILKHTEAGSILVKHGIHCPLCPFARIEMASLKIGEVARAHNVNIDELLKELNDALSESRT